MTVKLLTEHHLELLSLKGGCTGSSESTLVKIPHCWKSHVSVMFVMLCLGPPGVLGIWGEWLFIFRELASTGNYFRGAREQAHYFGDIGSLAKKQKKKKKKKK